jgi:hypothetical protein
MVGGVRYDIQLEAFEGHELYADAISLVQPEPAEADHSVERLYPANLPLAGANLTSDNTATRSSAALLITRLRKQWRHHLDQRQSFVADAQRK